jgi:ATP-dependent Clp protease ATP-binding subunit ClpA
MIPNVDRETYFALKDIDITGKVTSKMLFEAIHSTAVKIDKHFLAETVQNLAKSGNKTVNIHNIVERALASATRSGRSSISMNDLTVATMVESGVPGNTIASFIMRVGAVNSPLHSPFPGNILPRSLEKVVVGRKNEIAKVAMMMNKKTRIIALTGGKGIGKNTVVQGVAKAIAAGRFPSLLSTIIDLNEVIDDTHKMMDEQGKPNMLTIPTSIIENKNNYVYINHEQFARALNITDTIPMLIDSGINIILSSSTEYVKSLRKNTNLVHHIEELEIEELPKAVALTAIVIGKRNIEDQYFTDIPEELCEFTYSISSRFPMEQIQPGRTLTILEQAVAIKRLGDMDAIDHLMGTDIEKMLKTGHALEAKDLLVSNHDFILTGLKTGRITMDEADISGLMVSQLGISPNVPAGALTSDSVKQLGFLEEFINKYVYGQKEAIKAVCDGIRRKALNITTNKSPANYMFVGTTGTGKTYVAKKIAELMFGSEDALIRVDMSEFSEKHTISRLIGSPPGYVGYDDGGQLTDKVRKRPHSVVLLDEIEKAHKEVLNVLLQILSDGRLTDGKGRTVSFRECIIIMTSNLGTKSDIGDIGFDAPTDKITKKNVMESVKRFFSPELFNRIGRIVMFNALGDDEIKRIIAFEMSEAAKNTKFKMTFTDKVTQYVFEKCKTLGNVKTYGGREVNRVVQDCLFNVVTDKIMETGKSPNEVLVDVDTELKVTVK